MTSRKDKIKKCFSDHMFLIDTLPVDVDHPLERTFVVMGSSGNPYQVTISNYPRCTCTDNQLNGRRCKHIFFVLLRIMNATNYMRRKYSDTELVSMYVNIPSIETNLIYKGKKPKIKEVVEQKFDEGDKCPICLDLLENGKELDFCKYSCGKTIHKECHKQWKVSKGNICVYCRGKWYSDGEEFYQIKVSYHPIKKNGNVNGNINGNVNGNNTNNDNNQNPNPNNQNQNNNNEINNEEENFEEMNEKINLILQNAAREDEENPQKNKIKIKKKRGRKKQENGSNSKKKRTRKKKNIKNENENEKEEDQKEENGRKSRSRSKEKIEIRNE